MAFFPSSTMALNEIQARQRLRRTNTSGLIPTIPLTTDHTDGTWLTTDIYIGEFFFNQVDFRMFTRTYNGIKELKVNSTNDTQKNVLTMGDWDMDADPTFSIAHGLTGVLWKTIKKINVIIRNDADTEYIEFSGYQNSSTVPATGNNISWDSVNILLNRQTSGPFDSTDFDSISYNRGWITFEQ